MKTRLKKEFRNLLSHCLPALFLIVGGAVLLRLDASGGGELALLSLVVYSLGFSIVGSALFGMESNVGLRCSVMTFPVSRRRLYAERMLIGGMISVFFIGMFCVISGIMTTRISLHHIVFYIPLCALGGGCFFALWLRETVAAFWATLLAPLLIICLIVLCYFFLDQDANETLIGMALVLYGLATQILAYFRYVGYEDDFLFDREVNIFTFSKIGAARSGRMKRHQPRSASLFFLIKKELRLLKFNLILAGTTAFLFGLVLFVQLGFKDPGQENDSLFGLLVLLRMVWAFIPVSMGAVMISDERRWGILSWNQVQPVRFSHQLWIKACVLIFMSCLLIGGGGIVLNRGLQMAVHHFNILELPMIWSKLHLFDAHFLLVVPVMTAIGLYASSLSRGFLQSLIISIGLILLIFVSSSVGSRLIPQLPPTHPYFLNILSCSVLIGIFGLILSVYNARFSSGGGRRIRLNLIGLGGTVLLSIVLTAVIYLRSWQWLIPVPVEVPISETSDPRFTFQKILQLVTILDPEGNMKALVPKAKRFDQSTGEAVQVDYTLTPLNWDKSEYPDLRWAVVGEGWWHAPAIAADGTLWEFEKHPKLKQTNQGAILVPSRLPIVKQMSSETEWIQVSGGNGFALALHRDGTLWGWGSNRYGQLGVLFENETKSTDELIQLGSDNDWVSIGVSNFARCYGVKQDGSLWVWGHYHNADAVDSSEGKKGVVNPVPIKVDTIENCSKIIGSSHVSIIEKKDNSVWLISYFNSIPKHEPIRLELESGIKSVTLHLRVACSISAE